MSDTTYLDWPFFEPRHAELARALDAWATENIPHGHGPDVDAECKALVKSLGEAGWLRHAVGESSQTMDARAICVIRETLARHSGLADFAFAMQGLGSGAISLHGTPEQRQKYLSKVATGEAISAFALSEPQAGSDVAAMACAAVVILAVGLGTAHAATQTAPSKPPRTNSGTIKLMPSSQESTAERERRLRVWKKAVTRTLDWVDDDTSV